jgi:hypothetical protein
MVHLLKQSRVLVIVGLIAAIPMELGGCNISSLHSSPDAGNDSSRDASQELGDSGPRVETGALADGADGRDGNGSDGAADADARASGDSADTRGDAGAAADARSDVTAQVDSSSDSTAATTCAACTAWGQPQAQGLSPAILPELSGLAASRLHPGLLYAHNDSGDSARFFALTEQAHVAAEVHLSGATATDWEDISVGPCPSGSCVYIGDTGDNKTDRTQYVIQRLAEPATLPSDGSVVTITSYESFPFVYPDGSHNAETLLVHPVTGQVFIVLKETGTPAAVYEMPLPLQRDVEVTLVRVATLAVPPAEGLVTDGSFHPCGDRILIRTTNTNGLFELARTPGASVASVFAATPVRVPLAVEPQGEAVTYATDGRRYFTASETVSGDPVPSLSVVTCTAF